MSSELIEIPLAEAIEASPTAPASFADNRWKTRWILLGVLMFSLLHVLPAIDRRHLQGVPPVLLLILGILIPQSFFLIFPLLTRDRNRRAPLKMPAFESVMIEFAIAIPIVIGIITTMLIVGYLLTRFAPGVSVTPDALRDLAASTDASRVYIFALAAFTVPPLCEEVFFRGFLYNALKARWPWLLACVVESLIFGFGHTFGIVHGAFASVLGLILTLVYQWRKSLLTPMFVHCGNNLFAALGIVALMFLTAHSPVLGIVTDPQQSACVVQQVTAGTGAESADLMPGDVVIKMDKASIVSAAQLKQMLLQYKAGDIVRLTIRRDGVEIIKSVELQKRSDPPPE